MIAVVGAELPEASMENKKLTTLGLILGFIVYDGFRCCFRIIGIV